MATDGVTGIDSDKQLGVKHEKAMSKAVAKHEISKIYTPIRKGLYDDFKKICESKNVSVSATMTQLIICVIAAETNRDMEEILKKEREYYLQIRDQLKDMRNESKRAATKKRAAQKQLDNTKTTRMSKASKNLVSTNPYDGSDVYEMLIKNKKENNNDQ